MTNLAHSLSHELGIELSHHNFLSLCIVVYRRGVFDILAVELVDRR